MSGIDVLPCDWPQCECDYECERQDKHEEFLRELAEFEPKAVMAKLDAAINEIKRFEKAEEYEATLSKHEGEIWDHYLKTWVPIIP
jgi:CRISPR/Cas system-associated protein Csm6